MCDMEHEAVRCIEGLDAARSKVKCVKDDLDRDFSVSN